MQKKPGAWITLVMIGDRYIPGALVLAQSIRELNTTYDLICMVTPDVSLVARKALDKVYTRVQQVAYITCHKLPKFRTVKQQNLYGKWIHHSFTKFNVFDSKLFGEYEKIIFLDADMVFIKNSDHLMHLPVYSMTFSTPWAKPYCKNGGITNAYLDPIKGTELSHGQLVSTEMIKKGREESFVGQGSLIVLKAETLIFETILDALEEGVRGSNCTSGMDEMVLIDVLLQLGRPMYNVHQQYNWVVGKENWLIPPNLTEKRTIQTVTQQLYQIGEIQPSIYQWYGILKPWEFDEFRWPDLHIWYNIAQNLLQCFPEIQCFIPNVKKTV